jgi:DNA primase
MYKKTLLEHVLPKLDLEPVRQEGHHNVYLCPFCGDSRRKSGHLYINMETGLWDCKLCSEAGNPLTLYARMRNISYSQAYKEIHSGCKFKTEPNAKEMKLPDLKPEAPIERRSAVYEDFLRQLPLYRRHALDLQRRGFTKKQVIRNLYRSLPDKPSQRKQIVSALASRHDLTGVRGFREKDGIWECFYISGYLIPFRDEKGRIQAMQIRTDSGEPKYLFFGFRDSGIDNSTPVHVVNPDVARRTRSAWVTEGPLKADVASMFFDACFVASPGVSSWRSLTPVLKDLNLEGIVQAFDRDQDENPAVKKCVEKFEEQLMDKIQISRAKWPPEYGNGVDDALMKISKTLEVEAHPDSLVIREIKETEITLKKAQMLS